MALHDPIILSFNRDDGESFLYIGGTNTTWGVVSIMGLEFPEPEIFTTPKGLGEGFFVTGKRLNGRTLEIHLRPRVRYINQLMEARTEAMTFFRPGHVFTINIQAYDNIREGRPPTREARLANAELAAVSYPVLQEQGGKEDLVLQFIAPEPYFEALTESEFKYTTTLETFSSRTFTYSGEGIVPFMISAEVISGNPTNLVALTFRQAGAGSESFQFEKADGSNFVIGDTMALNTETNRFEINGTVAPVEAAALAAIVDHWKVKPGTNAFGGNGYSTILKITLTYRGRRFAL